TPLPTPMLSHAALFGYCSAPRSIPLSLLSGLSQRSPRSAAGGPSIPSGSTPGQGRGRPHRDPRVDVFHGPEALHFSEVDSCFGQGARDSRRVAAGEEPESAEARSGPL